MCRGFFFFLFINIQEHRKRLSSIYKCNMMQRFTWPIAATVARFHLIDIHQVASNLESRAKSIVGALTLDTIERISILSTFPSVYVSRLCIFLPLWPKRFPRKELLSIFIGPPPRQGFRSKTETETPPVDGWNYLSPPHLFTLER